MNWKSKKRKSVFAFLLAVSMLTQQAGTGVMASEETTVMAEDQSTASAAADAVQSETQKDTKAVQESAADSVPTEAQAAPAAPEVQEPSEVSETPDVQVPPAEQETPDVQEPGSGDGEEPQKEPSEENPAPEQETTEVPSEAEPSVIPEDPSEEEPEQTAQEETKEEQDPEEEAETEDPEQAEAAVLSGSVTQEVYRVDSDGQQNAIVKYTIRIANSSEAASKGTTVKAVLPGTLSYYTSTEETSGISVNGNVVSWEGQAVAAASQNTYVFFAKAAQGVQDTAQLAAAFYIDGQQVPADSVTWINPELLVIETEEEKEEQGPTSVSTVCGGVNITVSAEPGVLKPGTEVVARKVNAAKAASAIEAALDENQTVQNVIAFDVVLKVDGQEVQPDDRVQVTFSNIPFAAAAQEESKELVVVHVDDGMSRATDMGASVISADVVSIETTHFSVYAVAVIENQDPPKGDITEKYQQQNSFSYTYKDENGTEKTFSTLAFDFHLFGKDIVINNHTNGNIAAENFEGCGNAFGTNQNRDDHILEYNYIGTFANNVGQIASGITILGKDVEVSLDGTRVKVGSNSNLQSDTVSKDIFQEHSNSEKSIDIDGELNKLKELSADLAKNRTTAGVDYHKPKDTNEKVTIDISKSQENVNYLQLSAVDLMKDRNKCEVEIFGVENKTLIVNVDMTGADSYTLANLVTKINGYNNSEDVTRSNCNLLWNFYEKDANGNIRSYSYQGDDYASIGTADYFMGTILAPDANVYYGAVNGSVIGQKLKSASKESHNWRFTGLSLNITVNKTLKDESASEAKTFYFAVFEDVSGTPVRVANSRVAAISVKNGETGSASFPNLQSGKTYYIYETDANGNRLDSGQSGYIITGNGQAVQLGSGSTVVNITNSKTGPATKTVSGTKIWDDKENQDGVRPASIRIKLLANGVVTKSMTVTDRDWSWSFTGLPVEDDNGNEIVYTVDEEAVPGYKASVNGYNITNTHKPETTSVSVTKVWKDNKNQDGFRPKSVTVQLYADEEPVNGKTVTLNEANKWKAEWTDLDKKSAGKDIVYTVKEVGEVTGYTSSVTGNMTEGFTITNSHTPLTTEVNGTKTWIDGNNQDGKRPASITVRLHADGIELKDKVVKTDEKGQWKYSFTNLPKYKDGKEIKYTVTEDKVEGYTVSVNGYDITNTYQPEKTSIRVTKVWDDADDRDRLRPQQINVQLYADGEKCGSEVTLNAANKWTYRWSDLEKKKDGNEIQYTVEEAGTYKGYTSKLKGSAETGYVITNTHAPETISVEGEKTWNDGNNQDGKRPESITVRLHADGIEIDSRTVRADSEGNWKYSFTDLPKYDNGNAITYTITEDAVPEYTTTIQKYDIQNSYAPGKTSVSVNKVWKDADDQDGKRPSEVRVQLYADGLKSGIAVNLSEANGWTYTWTDLPKKKDGKEIAYTVKEAGIYDGYEATITGNAKEGFIITNTHTPELVKVEGTKTWDDADNQDGKRPESIIVRLHGNGIDAVSKEVRPAEDGTWSYSFINLPKYHDGKEIVYTVTEDAVKDYTTTYDGYDIMNSYAPGKADIVVSKVWTDKNNQDGIRPAEISVQLYKDGEAFGETVKLNADNQWTYNWTGLDEKKDGENILYTVKEVDVPEGYIAVISGDMETGYTVTNTHNAESVEKTVTKEWKNDIPENRPEAILVQLFADGTPVGEAVELNEANAWKYTWTNLDKYSEGKEILYTAEEIEVPDGYTVSYSEDTLTITNTGTNVEISKVDALTEEPLAGAVLQITDAEGTVIEEWTTDGSAHVIAGRLNAGETYTLIETSAPEGYEIAEPITFTVGEDGITDPVVMKDTRTKSDNASIMVTKTLVYGGNPLAARDQTFYVALFEDEACTIQVSDVKPLVFKNAASSTAVFTDIEVGRTYYIAEVDGNGTVIEAGEVADGSVFVADFSEGREAVVEEEDGSVTVYFNNEFMNIPDGFYKDADLTITKFVVDADGNERNSDEVFYAGIFEDPEFTIPAQSVSSNLIALDLAGGSSVSETIKVDLRSGEGYCLYVTEVDENGVPVTASPEFGYTVTVDSEEVILDYENTTASVTIINQEIEEEEEEEEEEEILTPTPTEKPIQKTGVKTGDDTPIGFYMSLLAAAAVILIAVMIRKRRMDEE